MERIRGYVKERAVELLRGSAIWVLIIFFAYVYIVLGYLNATYLRSGIDLGTYTQILWNVNQGNLPPFNTIKGEVAWGDHAHIVMALFAPFFALFSSPITVLVIQVLCITTAAWAVYAIAQKILKHWVYSFVLTVSYLLFFGVQYALDFDFHANVLTAAVFAWSVYAFVFKRWPLYWLLLPLGWITREDAPTFYVMFGVYILLAYRLKYWKLATITIVTSAIYFFWITYGVMPRWNDGGTPLSYFDAPVESHNPLDIGLWVLGQPVTVWQNMTQTSIARRTMVFLFQSFGFTPLASPFTYLLAAPNFLARFLSPEEQRHMMKFHYSASLASVLAIGSVFATAWAVRVGEFFTRNKERWQPYVRHTLIAISTILLAWGTYISSWQDVDLPLRQLTNPESFATRYDKEDGYSMIQALHNFVKPGQSVATVGSLVPWFADRKEIYVVPYKGWEGADWIILTNRFDSWPMSRKEVDTLIPQLRKDERYERFYDAGGVYAFRKKSATVDSQYGT